MRWDQGRKPWRAIPAPKPRRPPSPLFGATLPRAGSGGGRRVFGTRVVLRRDLLFFLFSPILTLPSHEPAPLSPLAQPPLLQASPSSFALSFSSIHPAHLARSRSHTSTRPLPQNKLAAMSTSSSTPKATTSSVGFSPSTHPSTHPCSTLLVLSLSDLASKWFPMMDPVQPSTSVSPRALNWYVRWLGAASSRFSPADHTSTRLQKANSGLFGNPNRPFYYKDPLNKPVSLPFIALGA